jgi:putative Holliday junction resolvase
MARLLAIDYGLKRTGIAVSDPLKIIATGLTTISSRELISFLRQYTSKEEVEKIIVGLPLNLDNTETHGTAPARAAIESIRKEFPSIPVVEADERLTSKMARRAMVEMDLRKSKRKDKKILDEIAATILLQEFMGVD